MFGLTKKIGGLIFGIVLLLAGIYIGFSASNKMHAGLTDHQVRDVIMATIQVEADTTFLVTGYYDVDTTIQTKDDKTLWGISLGTTEVRLRVPGRVSYGIPVGKIRPQDIVIQGQNVTITVPQPEIWSVQPDLQRMEVQTQVGWARLQAYSGRALEQAAFRKVPDELRHVAARSMQSGKTSVQNTEKALKRLLVPILTAAGVQNPTITIRIEPVAPPKG